ncbi:MAG: efflux RND transporter periplasmic adaptor subunit [Steroidobacteraceae bacterium]
MNINSKVKDTLLYAGRMSVTLAVVAAAIFAGRLLWRHYQVEPWTRDGRVRADVVQIAPDVSGLVSRVEVANDQSVARGQALFYVDRDRYALALRQAEAAVAAQRAALAQFQREDRRNAQLGDLVAAEITEQSAARVAAGEAALAQANAARDLAKLNLQRTVVVAPTDGSLSDLTLRVGDYVTAGKPVLALIDRQSLRVEGYFEETKLKRVHVGQPVTVQLMGESELLHGHVQSIANGIEDRDRAASANLLPNVNPVFNWVRLAQRVPVRIALDREPSDVRLVIGRTATVAVVEAPATRKAQP